MHLLVSELYIYNEQLLYKNGIAYRTQNLISCCTALKFYQTVTLILFNSISFL